MEEKRPKWSRLLSSLATDESKRKMPRKEHFCVENVKPNKTALP